MELYQECIYTENELVPNSIKNKIIILNDFNGTKNVRFLNKSITISPDDIVLEEILNNTYIDNFINICKDNKRYYDDYCSNDLLWIFIL